MQGLACPRCDGGLNKNTNGQLCCPACRVDFPRLGQVEFLWAEPGAALLDWRNRYNFALAELEARQAAAEASQPELDSARPRVERLCAGLKAHHAELTSLLTPLRTGEVLARETHLALRTRLPGHHGLLSYANNILRDWCWGGEENTQVLAHLTGALENFQPGANGGRMLVLGAGAGRLACDLHQTLAMQTTWALDSNPLLCLVGAEMSRGSTLPFTEFPLAPLHAEHVAVEQTLQGVEVEPATLFVCADALRAPFAERSFDLVVTPWLLDVVDAEIGPLLARIARLLEPGGLWLTHGSLAFEHADPAWRLSADDLAAVSAAHGFDVVLSTDIELPYLQSPHSRQHRTETAHTQVCQRNAQEVPAPPRYQHLPEWLVNPNLPVMASKEFRAQLTTTRVHAFIMSLIDGKRSVKDMAQVLEQQRLMPAREGVQAIRQFMTRLHEEAARMRRGG